MFFNNAFLTINKAVGMQFNTSKERILTIYPDKNGVLHFSEEATPEEKAKLMLQYARRKTWYYGNPTRFNKKGK